MQRSVASIADIALENSLKALDPLLGFYHAKVRLNVAVEVEEVRDLADRLDRKLQEIIDFCVRSREAKEIGAIFSQLRADTFQFLHSQAVTIQLLRLYIALERTRSREKGLNGAVGQLVIERSGLTIDEIRESMVPSNRATVSILRETPASLWNLLVCAPLATRSNVKVWSGVGLEYAASLQKYFSAALKGIRIMIWKQLGRTIWAELQQHWGTAFSVTLAVGFAIIGWALGFSFPTLGFAIVLGLITWVATIFLERVFKQWHLRWYGRLCAHTALNLYTSRVLAAASAVGLEEIAQAKTAAGS